MSNFFYYLFWFDVAILFTLEFVKLLVLDLVTRLIDADNGLCCNRFDCNNSCVFVALFALFVMLFVCSSILLLNIDVTFVLVKLEIKAGFVCNKFDLEIWCDVDAFAVATDLLVLIVRIFGLHQKIIIK